MSNLSDRIRKLAEREPSKVHEYDRTKIHMPPKDYIFKGDYDRLRELALQAAKLVEAVERTQEYAESGCIEAYNNCDGQKCLGDYVDDTLAETEALVQRLEENK